jgi:uncharacterized protein (UPF0303 family)
MTEMLASLLAVLEEQERRLVFTKFDNVTAWDLGVRIREMGLAHGLAIVVSIRRHGQLLFHAALPGSSADNDGWVDRKAAVVDRYGRSSYLVGTQFRLNGRDFDTHSRLDLDHFAAHGGSFPINICDVGCVGSVTVSGLSQADDHNLVVAAIEDFLNNAEQAQGSKRGGGAD